MPDLPQTICEKEKIKMKSYLKDVLPFLPNLLTRKDIKKFFGNLISPRYLANLDSEQKGPKRAKIGQKVVYKREDFIDWLSTRLVSEN